MIAKTIAAQTAPPTELADDAGSGGSALTRMLQILDRFTIEHPMVHVDEVIAAFGVGQSTAYRYLRELSDAGLVAAQGKGVYSLGRRIVELEQLLHQSDPLLIAGKHVMDGLTPYFNNRSFLLCTPYNGRVLCVHKAGPDDIVFAGKAMPIQRGRGTSFALFRGAGSQVILAYMPPHQIKSLYLGHAAEIAESGLGTTWAEFRTALSQIRRQGYAETIGRVNKAMYSIAVPVMRHDGNSNGKVSGSVLMLGATDAVAEGRKLVPMLRSKADAIAAELAAELPVGPR